MKKALSAAFCAVFLHFNAPLFADAPFVNFSKTRIALADTLPPIINCPEDDTVQLGPGQCSALYNYSVLATDDQPGWTVTQELGLSSGGDFPLGKTINRFRAQDAAGNSSTCSFEVVVRNYAVTISCRDLSLIPLNLSCTDTVQLIDVIENQVLGCPDVYAVQLDRSAPFGNGPWSAPRLSIADKDKTFGFRVQDLAAGNSCWGLIQVVDNTPPSLACPSISVPCFVPTAPAFLRDSLGLTGAFPQISDNCTAAGNVTLQFFDTEFPGACDSAFQRKIQRRWVATDVNANSKTCIQQVYLMRDSLPNVQFPTDRTLPCPNPNDEPSVTGSPFLQFGNFRASLLQSACNLGASYEDVYISLCSGSVRNVRQWTLIDWCTGQVVEHTQNIDILDNTPPAIACPADLTVTLNAQNCTVALDLPDAVMTDGCSRFAGLKAFWNNGADSLAATLSNFPANNPAVKDTLALLGLAQNLPVGISTLRYVGSDACGNAGACTFRLTIWDSVPPTATCAALQAVALGSDGTAAMPALAFNAGSADACIPNLAFKVRRADGNCQPPGDFGDSVAFCCADAGDTIQVVLRAYDAVLPVGAVAPSFAAGQAGACTARVLVRDTLPVGCTAPPDVSVACPQFDPTLASYGTGLASTCQTSNTLIVNDYTGFDSVCQRGLIVRTWQVSNAAGHSNQCSQRIFVRTDTAAMRSFFVKFPNDLVAFDCNGTANFGAPEVFGSVCAGLKMTSEDQIYTVVPDACFKIERLWTLRNTCIADTNVTPTYVLNPAPNALPNSPINLVGPVVSAPGTPAPWSPTLVAISANNQTPVDFSTFWNLNANGYQYKQIIKIIDNEDPVPQNCPAQALFLPDSSGSNDPMLWNETYWSSPSGGNDLFEGPVEPLGGASDCGSVTNISAIYWLYLDLDGDGIQESVQKSNTPPLPGMVNYNNASLPGQNGGTPRQFDRRQVPTAQKYVFSLKKEVAANNVVRFRAGWATQSAPDDLVPMQLPRGRHKIRWFFEDDCGNESICEYPFMLFDPAQPYLSIGGQLATENNEGLRSANVKLTGTVASGAAMPPISVTTTASGQYAFSNIMLGNGTTYTITPTHGLNPLNGVSTFDLLLISKHILGVDTLESPYKIIAADANLSNSVSASDIVEIRKVILGLASNFSHGQTWRFVPRSHAFADPYNPFVPGFPGNISRANALVNQSNEHFVAVKIGDVNGNANPNLFSQNGDDRGGETLPLSARTQRLRKGETVEVPLLLSGSGAAHAAAAWQLALRFEPADLELLRVGPGGDWPGFSLDNVGLAQADSGLVRAIWFSPEGREHMLADSGTALFSLTFRARREADVFLKNADETLPARAFDAEGHATSLALVMQNFDKNNVPAGLCAGFSPQPAAPGQALRFWAENASAGSAALRVFDGTGRLLFSQHLDCRAGEKLEKTLPESAHWPNGLLTWELRDAAGTRVAGRLAFL